MKLFLALTLVSLALTGCTDAWSIDITRMKAPVKANVKLSRCSFMQHIKSRRTDVYHCRFKRLACLLLITENNGNYHTSATCIRSS